MRIYFIPFATKYFKQFLIPEFEVEGYKIFPLYEKQEKSEEGYDLAILYMKPSFSQYLLTKKLVSLNYVT